MVLTLLVGTRIASIEGTALSLPPHEPSITLPSSAATLKLWWLLLCHHRHLQDATFAVSVLCPVTPSATSSPKSNVSFSTPTPSSPSSSKALHLTSLSRIPVTPPAAPSLKSSVLFSTLTCRRHHLQRYRLQRLCLISQ